MTAPTVATGTDDLADDLLRLELKLRLLLARCRQMEAKTRRTPAAPTTEQETRDA